MNATVRKQITQDQKKKSLEKNAKSSVILLYIHQMCPVGREYFGYHR